MLLEEFPKNTLWKYFIVGITVNFLVRVHCTTSFFSENVNAWEITVTFF